MPFRMITGGLGSMVSSQVVLPPGWSQCAPPTLTIDFNTPTSSNFGLDSVVVDPVDQSVIVGSCYQGLWKSYDHGSTWAKLNTGTGGAHIDSGRIWALAIDPQNHNIIWATAGYGDGGPLKSTDGGVSWTAISVGAPTQNNDVYAIALDPSTSGHVLLSWHSAWTTNGVDSGVSESSDGGSTWTNHQPSAAWGAGTSVFFLTNSTTWLVCTQAAGIYRTTNSGTSWTQVSVVNMTHGGIGCLMDDPVNGDWYLAISNNILRSTAASAGVAWTNISTGLPGNYVDAVTTDGTNLYTGPSYPTNEYIDGPWYYMPIGGSSWSSYALGDQHMGYTNLGVGPCHNGPVMGAYDPVNKIGYSAQWLAGLWRIQG